MQKEKPLVSIICVTMNHERYIKNTLLSLIHQTYANTEILVVDNNSSDKTYEIALETLERSGARYELYRREKSYSVTSNVNFLISKTKGKYVSMFSGDDWMMLDCLEQQVAYYEQNPQFGFVYSNGWYFYEDINQFVLAETKDFIAGHIFDHLLLVGVLFPIGLLVKKSTFDAIGSYDETLAIDDLDLWLRVAKEYEIGYFRKPMIFYRKHGTGMTSMANRYKNIDDYLKIIDKYKEHRLHKTAHRYYRKHYILGYCLNDNYKAALPYMIKDFRFERFYISVLLRHFLWRQTLKVLGLRRTAKN